MTVHLFPVRHHSPRTSFVLRAVLDRVRPDLVLVEGPQDADPLIDVLVDRETVPPVALLAWRTDGTPGSAMWPFASYSPEYEAVRWARAHGVAASFCDVPSGSTFDADRSGPEQEEVTVPLRDQAATALGFRSFEEFWEASFEAPDYDEASFHAALLAFAEMSRHDGPLPWHRARDAWMARRLAAAEGGVVAVLGAAHAAAIAAGDVDPALVALVPEPVPTGLTVVPYSFPRLAEQTGYGAGNRAPQFYQRAWDAGLSYRRAALEVLVDFTDHLRVRGFMASLADTIEAYRLACALADLRGKGEPGLDEIREATVSTLCRGDATHVDGFLWPTVIGRNVGRVAGRIGKNSLQEEFWQQVRERHLPATDEPEEFALKLHDPVQVETSVFLHRLRVASIPYAVYRGSRATGGRAPEPEDEAGGISALVRVREQWQAQWTPATDVALVERIVLGESLEAVCRRLLAERLLEAKSTSDAANVLLESVVAGVVQTVSTALAACDRLAATDDDLASLARACRALSGLVAYGSSRGDELGGAAIPPLCVKTFDRAILRVRPACTGDDEATAVAADALRVLHEIALSQPLVDRGTWIAEARWLVDDGIANPRCAGLAAGLLFLARELSDEEVVRVVSFRLSDPAEPERAASFLAGFLEVNALVLVKSRPIVEALDAFLVGMEPERFRDALPVLRRAFSQLGATERRYLVENVVGLRKLGGQAREVAAVIAEKDKAALAAMGAEIAAAMDDLDDLL